MARRRAGRSRARNPQPAGRRAQGGRRGRAYRLQRGDRPVADHAGIPDRPEYGPRDPAGRQPARPGERLSGRSPAAADLDPGLGRQSDCLVRHHPARRQQPADPHLRRLHRGFRRRAHGASRGRFRHKLLRRRRQGIADCRKARRNGAIRPDDPRGRHGPAARQHRPVGRRGERGQAALCRPLRRRADRGERGAARPAAHR